MAPFLRISFNSYELGSLEPTDEASQPFCAVKMKEALSTGRAGSWTLERRQPPAGLGVRASERQWRGPALPHRLLAQPRCGCRTVKAARSPRRGSALWLLPCWLFHPTVSMCSSVPGPELGTQDTAMLRG